VNLDRFKRYVDADGIQRERKGCPDRRETEGMAAHAEAEAAKIKSGMIDPKAVAYGIHEARPLRDHLADFRKALEAKGDTRKQAMVTAHRAERILNLARARRISDLSLSKALDALAALRDEGLSVETINHHVRAVKAFGRWLWIGEDLPDPGAALDPQLDHRHLRQGEPA
jgi:hypothetical protein